MSTLLNQLCFSLGHFLMRDHISGIIKLQKKHEELSYQELSALQNKKLNMLLNDVIHNVPYYKNIFEKRASSICIPKLSDFPILNKQIIRENFEQLKHANIACMKAEKSSTSGSTGESLFFMISNYAHMWSDASFFRDFKRMNCSPLAPQATLWGARFDNKIEHGIKGFVKRHVKPFYFFSSYDLTEEKMAYMARILQEKKVEILTSYPSPLEYFAQFVQQRNLTFPCLKAIISSSEQLFSYQREMFESIFGCPVFNRYGSREFGCIAFECKQHNGLHIEADHVFIEILDEKLQPCSSGQVGGMYITNLDNYAMPLIRYKIGDMASWSNHRCSCGCNFPLLEKIEGRSFDLVKDSEGHVVSGTFWSILIRHLDSDVIAFQVIQDSINHIMLNIVRNDYMPNEKESLLKKHIFEKLPALNVTINYVNEIPLTKSGKRRFVISNINN